MRFITLISCAFLTACSAGYQSPINVYASNDALPYPSLAAFPHCRSYGCEKIDTISLDANEQAQIKALFQDNSTPILERENIAKAIGLFEIIVGRKTGTSADVAGTYMQLGHMQHDCIDESTNTTTYLILLNQMGLLTHHTVNALTSRPPILSGRLGPHRTAVIIHKTTGVKYAVDSWFFDNGHDAQIIELDTWRWGWHPDKSPTD
jgi:hypothetical protein